MKKLKEITNSDKKVIVLGVRIKKKERKMKMIKQGAGVTSKQGADVLEFKLWGDVDHHNAKVLRKQMDDDIFLYRPKRVELDLSGVDFMDSSGLGLIIGRFNTAAEIGGKLILKRPTKRVEKVLSLAGVERIITIDKA